MWTLRLRGPKGKAATVQITPDTTLQEFCDLAMLQLAINGKKLRLTFRCGFPPRVVEYSPDDTLQDKFANNDTIVVDTATPSAEPRQAVAPPSAAKRVAPAAKAKAKEPARSGGVHSLTGGSALRTSAANKRKDRGAGVRLGESLEEESVVVEPAGESTSAHKYRRTRAVQLTSKDDIAVKLVEAVSGSSKDRVGKFFRAATKSAVEHQYEMTLANARLNAALSNKFEIFEVKKATATATATATAAAGEGEEAPGEIEMRVKFKESVRKWKEETVTLLQPVELQAVLKYVLISGGETGREMLKPFNMAQVSPRVFWSIARLYKGDVAAGLAELVPEEDWSFLDTRTRQRSKKAVEAQANEEVYKQWKKRGTAGAPAPSTTPSLPPAQTTRASGGHEVISVDTDDDADQEEKAKVSEQQQMQTAMEYAEQAKKRSLRDAMAHAAAGRVEARARAQAVTSAIRESSSAVREPAAASVVKPKTAADPEETESDGAEDEEDEDIEKTTAIYCDVCNKARILSIPEAEAVGAQEMDGGEWTCARLASINREASCDALDDELQQIAGEKLARLLQQQAKIRTREELANATLVTALRQLAHPLDSNYAEIKTKLEELIDEARLDEVNDAMAEIVGGDGDLVGTLELQKLGTPADLVETPADLIVSSLASRKKAVGMETAANWQQQAREKITSCPWMGEWRTI